MSKCMRSIRCVEQLRLVSGLSGDIVEMGVFEGETTIALATYLKENKINKKIYACDVFGGLPYDGAGIDSMLKKGECYSTLELFMRNVEAAKVEEYIIPIVGLVENTLYARLGDKKWCLAFLDMDLYIPTSYAVRYLDSRIVLGGVMGFHDYKFERCPGIERVVDNEVDRNKFKMYGDHVANCAWLQKVQ